MKIKPIEKVRPQHPRSLYAGTRCSPQERLFVLLCLLGYSQSEAYRIAISPNAKASSASVAGCNLMRQKNVQRAAQLLVEAFINKEWELNTSILRYDIIDP